MSENKSLQDLLNEIDKLIKAYGYKRVGRIEIEVNANTCITYKNPCYETP